MVTANRKKRRRRRKRQERREEKRKTFKPKISKPKTQKGTRVLRKAPKKPTSKAPAAKTAPSSGAQAKFTSSSGGAASGGGGGGGGGSSRTPTELGQTTGPGRDRRIRQSVPPSQRAPRGGYVSSTQGVVTAAEARAMGTAVPSATQTAAQEFKSDVKAFHRREDAIEKILEKAESAKGDEKRKLQKKALRKTRRNEEPKVPTRLGKQTLRKFVHKAEETIGLAVSQAATKAAVAVAKNKVENKAERKVIRLSGGTPEKKPEKEHKPTVGARPLSIPKQEKPDKPKPLPKVSNKRAIPLLKAAQGGKLTKAQKMVLRRAEAHKTTGGKTKVVKPARKAGMYYDADTGEYRHFKARPKVTRKTKERPYRLLGAGSKQSRQAVGRSIVRKEAKRKLADRRSGVKEDLPTVQADVEAAIASNKIKRIQKRTGSPVPQGVKDIVISRTHKRLADSRKQDRKDLRLTGGIRAEGKKFITLAEKAIPLTKNKEDQAYLENIVAHPAQALKKTQKRGRYFGPTGGSKVQLLPTGAVRESKAISKEEQVQIDRAVDAGMRPQDAKKLATVLGYTPEERKERMTEFVEKLEETRDQPLLEALGEDIKAAVSIENLMDSLRAAKEIPAAISEGAIRLDPKYSGYDVETPKLDAQIEAFKNTSGLYGLTESLANGKSVSDSFDLMVDRYGDHPLVMTELAPIAGGLGAGIRLARFGTTRAARPRMKLRGAPGRNLPGGEGKPFFQRQGERQAYVTEQRQRARKDQEVAGGAYVNPNTVAIPYYRRGGGVTRPLERLKVTVGKDPYEMGRVRSHFHRKGKAGRFLTQQRAMSLALAANAVMDVTEDVSRKLIPGDRFWKGREPSPKQTAAFNLLFEGFVEPGPNLRNHLEANIDTRTREQGPGWEEDVEVMQELLDEMGDGAKRGAGRNPQLEHPTIEDPVLQKAAADAREHSMNASEERYGVGNITEEQMLFREGLVGRLRRGEIVRVERGETLAEGMRKVGQTAPDEGKLYHSKVDEGGFYYTDPETVARVTQDWEKKRADEASGAPEEYSDEQLRAEREVATTEATHPRSPVAAATRRAEEGRHSANAEFYKQTASQLRTRQRPGDGEAAYIVDKFSTGEGNWKRIVTQELRNAEKDARDAGKLDVAEGLKNATRYFERIQGPIVRTERAPNEGARAADATEFHYDPKTGDMVERPARIQGGGVLQQNELPGFRVLDDPEAGTVDYRGREPTIEPARLETPERERGPYVRKPEDIREGSLYKRLEGMVAGAVREGGDPRQTMNLVIGILRDRGESPNEMQRIMGHLAERLFIETKKIGDALVKDAEDVGKANKSLEQHKAALEDLETGYNAHTDQLTQNELWGQSILDDETLKSVQEARAANTKNQQLLHDQIKGMTDWIEERQKRLDPERHRQAVGEAARGNLESWIRRLDELAFKEEHPDVPTAGELTLDTAELSPVRFHYTHGSGIFDTEGKMIRGGYRRPEGGEHVGLGTRLATSITDASKLRNTPLSEWHVVDSIEYQVRIAHFHRLMKGLLEMDTVRLPVAQAVAEAKRRTEATGNKHTIIDADAVFEVKDATDVQPFDLGQTLTGKPDAGGTALVVPEVVVKVWEKNTRPLKWYELGSQFISRNFVGAVLSLSLPWQEGNVADLTTRMALLGGNPFRNKEIYDAVHAAMVGTPENPGIAPFKGQALLEAIHGHFGSRGDVIGPITLKQVMEHAPRLLKPIGELTRLGDAFRKTPFHLGTAREMGFNVARRLEDPFIHRISGRVLDQMAREIGIVTNDHAELGRRLATRLSLDEGLAAEFHKRTLEIVGDYTKSPLGRTVFSLFDPFYTWVRESLKFTFYTLPAKHPIKTALGLQAMLQTEMAKAGLMEPNMVIPELGLFRSDEVREIWGAPGPDSVFLEGAIPVGDFLLPTVPLTSFGEAAKMLDNPIDYVTGRVLPYVQGPGAAALGGTFPYQKLGPMLVDRAEGVEQYNPEAFPRSERLAAGASNVVESFVPGAGEVNRVVTVRGNKAQGSTLWDPKVEGEQMPAWLAALGGVAPFKETKPGKGPEAAQEGGGGSSEGADGKPRPADQPKQGQVLFYPPRGAEVYRNGEWQKISKAEGLKLVNDKLDARGVGKGERRGKGSDVSKPSKRQADVAVAKLAKAFPDMVAKDGNVPAIIAEASRAYDIPPSVIAGVLKVESGFGTNMGPSSAGALGWGQFMPDTWNGGWFDPVDADGDGKKDPYNAEDAIHSTAKYLKEVGGGDKDIRAGLFSYNHADWYVDMVLEASKQYESGLWAAAGTGAGMVPESPKVPRRQALRYIKAAESPEEVASEQGVKLSKWHTMITGTDPLLQQALIDLAKDTGTNVEVNEGFRTEKRALEFPSGLGSMHHQRQAFDVNNEASFTDEQLEAHGLTRYAVSGEPWHWQLIDPGDATAPQGQGTSTSSVSSVGGAVVPGPAGPGVPAVSAPGGGGGGGAGSPFTGQRGANRLDRRFAETVKNTNAALQLLSGEMTVEEYLAALAEDQRESRGGG